MEEGGLSGAPLNKKSTNVIKHLNKCLNRKIPIIGVGGIITAEDGIEKINNGASLIQIYTGLIFRGHRLVNELRKATRSTRARKTFDVFVPKVSICYES